MESTIIYGEPFFTSVENYFVEKIYEKNIIFSFLFTASVLQAAEFEVVDQFTVDGATILRSSVQVIVPNTVPLSLWVSTYRNNAAFICFNKRQCRHWD